MANSLEGEGRGLGLKTNLDVNIEGKGFAGFQPGTVVQVIFMHRMDFNNWILM